MTIPNKTPRRPAALPASFKVQAGRLVPDAGAPVPRAPRAEDAPVEPDPEKKPDPEKCAACDADVPPAAKYCPECGKEMPAQDEAAQAARFVSFTSDQAVMFASFAIGETRAKSLDAAKGTIVAWREQAGNAAALAAQLADKSTRLATIERERLLERSVAEGRLEPGEAWAFSVDKDGNKVRSFSEWAGPPNAEKGTGQSLEQLAAYIAQRPTASAPAKPFTPSSKSTTAAATAPPGLNPEAYAAASRQVAALCGEK